MVCAGLRDNCLDPQQTMYKSFVFAILLSKYKVMIKEVFPSA